MNKEEILNFIKEHADNFSIQMKRHYKELYNSINVTYNFPTFGEKLYHYVYGDEVGKCKECEKPCGFDGFHKGYRKRCSYFCLNNPKKLPPITKTCPVCKKNFETDKRHNRVTCSIECQIKYVKLPEIKCIRIENAKNSMFKKYGVECAFSAKEFVEKSKLTKLNRYGNSKYVNSEKAKHTKLNKYGNENYNNIEQYKNTCLQKYGVDNPSKIPNVTKKSNIKKLEKFGEQMISNFAMERLKERLSGGSIGIGSVKFNDTMLEKYGTTVAMKVLEVSKQSGDTRKDVFYNEIVSGSRLGENIIPLFNREEYQGTRNKDGTQIFYKFECTKCQCEFYATIESGKIPNCQICNPTGKSKCELEIMEFIILHLPANIEIRRNDRQLIAPLEIDFYIPSKQVAIEFDGIIWHSELIGNKNKKYHLLKTVMANSKGVKLIHIFENEWELSKNIVKRKILKLIGSKDVISESDAFSQQTNIPIFARKCSILPVDNLICSDFLDRYHIQGSDRSSVKLGAFYENNLVATMTFGNRRIAMGIKNTKENEYEMIRFCVGEHDVIGAGGKLLSHFIKNYHPEKITTYADIRYSGLTSFYEKIGFSFCGRTEPNYWYFDKKNPYKLLHRFGFQKSVLCKRLGVFDPNISEWENMKANGFDRIWDCGNLKYEWHKQPV